MNKEDIQGLIARGYTKLQYAEFLLLEVIHPARARDYLRTVELTPAAESPEDTALHIAFTRPGLEKLGISKDILDTFAREFSEGMDHAIRARALGDQGVNHPSEWLWGHHEKPHALVLIYAKDETTFPRFVRKVRGALEGAFRVIAAKTTVSPERLHQKEHFGWRDGISTPIVQEFGGKDLTGSWTYPFRVGEFVLGYENEYGAYTDSPTVPFKDDPDDWLPLTPDKTAKDLGCNGTYLVYREMTQDVPELWKYLEQSSREPGVDRADSAIALGAKMVGRWPDGVPLVSSKARDGATSDQNDFLYYKGDRHGIGCPLGAHIRRSNPRDDLPTDHGDQNSVDMVRKHQMLRRGRPFGEPLADTMQARDILAKSGEPDSVVRGLHFICLVGHIGRQFEFVQRAWINSPNFAALSRDADPIIGVHREVTDHTGNASDEFTCQAEPLRRKYKGLKQFTQLVGGAYFFLPSLTAVRFIAGKP